MTEYLAAVRHRVVIFDGATGTGLQRLDLGPDDFGGPDLEGCNEILNLTRPDVVAELHAEYLAVGADVIETNTFGAFDVPLAEYGLEHRTFEINVASARIAREVASGFSTIDHPRWVAGSIGPGTKFASLGQITYATLRGAYEIQAAGLLEGGVDLFIIETQFDLLGLKAAIAGCRRAMAAAGRSVPIQAQVTIETTGRMLPGTEIAAALAAVDPLRPEIFGLNCATGPVEMAEHLRHLSTHSRMPISVIPNAGMPRVEDGKMAYDLAAKELADHHERFITEFGVTVVGGCCGTTPQHIAELVERCRHLEPARRQPTHEPGATSIYSFVPFEQDVSMLLVGERTNANGSARFRDALLAEDWDACTQMARDQVRDGSHVIDVCVDYVGRDGVVDMNEIASRFATQVSAPLVLDSTEPPVMEAALHHVGGRAILNSANLEDGEAEGSRFDRVMRLAREHGAAVICLLIDEEGQARNVEWKMRIAHRIHDLATRKYGLETSDLIFDPLTFPLSTGGDDLRGDAMETLDALRRIKAELPGAHTVLGVSNVSFGLKSAVRQVLNSVFLHEAHEAGLDAAIAHSARILPLNRVPEDQRRICADLIYDQRADGYDPLASLLAAFEDVGAIAREREDRSDWSVERRLEERIVDGERDGLVDDLDAAMAGGLTALEIINGVLLAGMRRVGDLFASGEMQLPFVLQSAETMKASVTHLEPFMEVSEATHKASIVLATVKGDVHDIGKNLVDIILTNNGYDVHNLGIKVSLAEMLETASTVDADAIGMSGLLVKSTLIMRDNLIELNERNLSHTPVILGGAALTRRYVERDLREVYRGPLFYGKDAFAGLRVMDRIAEIKRTGAIPVGFGREPEGRVLPDRTSPIAVDADVPARAPGVAVDNTVFSPPFVGSRIVKGIALDEIAGYINETALFRNQWQFRPEGDEDDDAFKVRVRALLREQLAIAREADLLQPQVVYGYFPVNADGNELIVWDDESRANERTRFAFPRQQSDPFLCVSDFHRPLESGEVDYAAFHIVTMGQKVSERTAQLFADDRYRDYLFAHGLGVEMAEALAELWHRRIREEWGFAQEDGPTLQGLFRQKHRGGRYSWGYPACPDLQDNQRVADLLGADRIGVDVGIDTGWQYQPEQTTSAIICHHPRAKYFIVR